MNMKNVLVIPWAYEELNLVQFFKEYMLACLHMLIRQFGRTQLNVVQGLMFAFGLLRQYLGGGLDLFIICSDYAAKYPDFINVLLLSN